MDRREFIQSISAAAAVPAMARSAKAHDPQFGPLQADPGKIMDLPEGFRYSVVSRAGDLMDDGLRVPGWHDGMAAFSAPGGRIALVCNHEIEPGYFERSAFVPAYADTPQAVKKQLYDRGQDKTPGCGGTTTTLYNPSTGESERQHLSLAGTELNCAGGPTPWGSWLSCEEVFTNAGSGWSAGRRVIRDQPHGYVFEVASGAEGLVAPEPIKAMGKFEHEAAAVHDRSGIVYMTEDRHYSLFYRYIPNTPGRLLDGGRLQALVIEGEDFFQTHNWSRRPDVLVGVPMRTRWIDLDDIDPVEDELRLDGAEAGAATFARGEGLCVDGDRMVFTCTIGGRARLGQVFSYELSPVEGEKQERDQPGTLTLIAEADDDAMLRNADNITMAPWGDLIVCEDTSDHCGLVGIRPDGSQYQLADNAYSNSELAGICFAPDGQTMFVNVQKPGLTVAISGPFPTQSPV